MENVYYKKSGNMIFVILFIVRGNYDFGGKVPFLFAYTHFSLQQYQLLYVFILDYTTLKLLKKEQIRYGNLKLLLHNTEELQNLVTIYVC